MDPVICPPLWAGDNGTPYYCIDNIPELASLALLGLGGLMMSRRRR